MIIICTRTIVLLTAERLGYLMLRRIVRVAAIGGVLSLALAFGGGLVGCGSSLPSDCTQGPVAIADFGTSVAVLGDSYASGEGTFNTGSCSSDNPPSYDYYAPTRTYVDGQGNVASGCHRSPGAFVPLLGVAMGNFVACSGATIGDVENGSKGFGKQINALNPGVRVVVLSVTGDDVGFGSLGSCINISVLGHGHPGTEADCNQAVKQTLGSIPRALPELVKLWATIETMTHGAWIIQLGYPRVFPLGGYEGGCNGISTPKQNQLNNVADTLDSALQKTADSYPHVKFEPTIGTFAGHEVCGSSSGKPYINDLQTDIGAANNCQKEYIVNGACSQSFHPNAWGYEAEAQLLKPVIAQLLATSSPSPSPSLSAGSGPALPISPSSISPGYATPKEAVSGFFHARFQGHETLACSYASPASRANCSSQNSQQPAISGNIALHDVVVSGKFALVEVTGRLCYPGRGCESNTNPLLGMPASPATFQQVYDDLVKSTTYTFSPYPCIRVGGKWYINFGP